MYPEIGYQLSSITPYLQTEGSIRDALQKIAALGWHYVQLQGVPREIDNNFLAEELQKNHLDCVATQEDYALGFGEHYEAAIRRAVTCGAQYLVFALLPREVDSVPALETFARKIGEIARRAQDAGLKFSFHPIGADFRLLDGVPVYRRLLELLPEIGLTFCVNAAFDRADPAEIFRDFGNRMELVHFKEHIVLPDGKTQMVPLGEGPHDWHAFWQMCREQNVKYVFAEQERWARDAFNCAAASLKYLQEIEK